MQKITIIWWTSGFWEWLTDFILKRFQNKVEITITWINEEKAKEVSEKLNCTYSLNNIEAVKDADITVFAVPIAYTESVIKEVCLYLKSWSTVLDVTSIKQSPTKAMIESVPDDILVIPTHPMFGPYVSSIAWQIIVLTPEEKNKEDSRYKFLKDFLEKEWAKVVETSPKEHDKMMAVVQWLTHFNMFVLWETLKRLHIDIEKSLNFVSPIYKIMLSSVARYMNQNPKLYWDIQMFNPEVLEVHKVFMETTNDFNKFVKEKDETNFIKTIEWTQKYFWENALAWQKYTDKIIYMISEQSEKAKNNIWKQVEIINIYTEKKEKWILNDFQNDIIIFENGNKYWIDEWGIL